MRLPLVATALSVSKKSQLLPLASITRPTNLVKHLFQIGFRVYPGCNGIAEEYKVLHDSLRIDRDHVTDASEGGVLLLVVSDVAKRGAPEKVPTVIQEPERAELIEGYSSTQQRTMPHHL